MIIFAFIRRFSVLRTMASGLKRKFCFLNHDCFSKYMVLEWQRTTVRQTIVNNDIQNLLEFIRVLVWGDTHGQGVGKVVTVDARCPHDNHEERRVAQTECQSPVVAVTIPGDENLRLLSRRNISRSVDRLPALHPHGSSAQHQAGVVPHVQPHAGGVRSPRTR